MPKRRINKYGEPGIVGEDYPVVIGAGSHQLTAQLKAEKNLMLQHDKQYCKKLYNNK